MRPDPRFVGLTPDFWANVRTISQEVGYTLRGARGQAAQIRVPTLAECKDALESIGLTASHLIGPDARPTNMGKQLIDYFGYRADTLSKIVEPLLMTAEQAAELYAEIRSRLKSTAPAPLNKQSAEKKRPAYFTGMINMLIQANLGRLPCNYDPQELTTVTKDRTPFRTLSRRIDGAFPGPVDPIAVWEIKEYYYTTTFGSRVADGVYETLLDGMELKELDQAQHDLAKVDDRPPHIHHLLMIDAHDTWWLKGRSYLCRILDMLHMGYVDEVLFGREIVSRLPSIVKKWVEEYRKKPRP